MNNKPTPPSPVPGGFKSVPFRIVANTLPIDAYRARLVSPYKRVSPYRKALEALANAKRGSVLCFESLKAYPRVKAIAKAMGYELHYAQDGDKLYVSILDTGKDK